jgi:hypothetical protein
MYGEGVSASYTTLDEYDFYLYGAYEADVSTTLSANGTEIDSGFGWDMLSAIAYLYDDVGPALYEVNCEHQIYSYEWGWIDLGETSDTWDDRESGGGSGGTELCEISYYWDSGVDEGEYAAMFVAYLGYIDGVSCYESSMFYPGEVHEDVMGVTAGCYDPFTDELVDFTFEDSSTWPVCSDGSYGCGDDPDEMSFSVSLVDRVQPSIASSWQGACYIWSGSQQLEYNGGYYWTNDVGIYLDGSNGTGFRGNASGSIY